MIRGYLVMVLFLMLVVLSSCSESETKDEVEEKYIPEGIPVEDLDYTQTEYTLNGNPVLVKETDGMAMWAIIEFERNGLVFEYSNCTHFIGGVPYINVDGEVFGMLSYLRYFFEYEETDSLTYEYLCISLKDNNKE